MFKLGDCVRLNDKGKDALEDDPEMLGAVCTAANDIGLIDGTHVHAHWFSVVFLRTGESLYLRADEIEIVLAS